MYVRGHPPSAGRATPVAAIEALPEIKRLKRRVEPMNVLMADALKASLGGETSAMVLCNSHSYAPER